MQHPSRLWSQPRGFSPWNIRPASAGKPAGRCYFSPLAQPLAEHTTHQRDMIDLPAIVNSVIGGLVVSLLVAVISAPIWWRWWKAHATALRWALFGAITFVSLTGIIVLPFVARELAMEHQERSSIPTHHIGLTSEEQIQARAECDMKSVEVTAVIESGKGRGKARRIYRAACMIEKGFRWK